MCMVVQPLFSNNPNKWPPPLLLPVPFFWRTNFVNNPWWATTPPLPMESHFAQLTTTSSFIFSTSSIQFLYSCSCRNKFVTLLNLEMMRIHFLIEKVPDQNWVGIIKDQSHTWWTDTKHTGQRYGKVKSSSAVNKTKSLNWSRHYYYMWQSRKKFVPQTYMQEDDILDSANTILVCRTWLPKLQMKLKLRLPSGITFGTFSTAVSFDNDMRSVFSIVHSTEQ